MFESPHIWIYKFFTLIIVAIPLFFKVYPGYPLLNELLGFRCIGAKGKDDGDRKNQNSTSLVLSMKPSLRQLPRVFPRPLHILQEVHHLP
jgi:hypothetical protein